MNQESVTVVNLALLSRSLRMLIYLFLKCTFWTTTISLLVLSTNCNFVVSTIFFLSFLIEFEVAKNFYTFIGFEIQSRAFFLRKLFQPVSKLWVEIGFLWHLPSMENVFAWWEFLKWENANIFELIPEVAIFSKSAISQPNSELICQI